MRLRIAVGHYSWGAMNKQPVTPDMEPTMEQSIDITEVQLGEPKNFLRVTYINMGKELTSKMDGFILEKIVAQNVCFISCFYIGM